MSNQILEKWGYLAIKKSNNDVKIEPKITNMSDDFDNNYIQFLTGHGGMSIDLPDGITMHEHLISIGFYDRHPEYIGKIDY